MAAALLREDEYDEARLGQGGLGEAGRCGDPDGIDVFSCPGMGGFKHSTHAVGGEELEGGRGGEGGRGVEGGGVEWEGGGGGR